MKLACILFALALTACGGGGTGSNDPTPTNPTNPTNPTPTSAPGGLYVGYYQEDPANNPEDPVPGAIYLNLPASNSAFSGNMFFTYVGCQTSNVGAVNGTKTSSTLSGNWSGLIDNISRGGTFSGTYNSAQTFYSGTYTVTGGKQAVNLLPCIQYVVAANGTWELFAVEQNVPSTFVPSVSGTILLWTCPAPTEDALIAVLDSAAAASTTGGNAVRFQQLLAANVTSRALPGLTSGTQYIATVACLNANQARVAVGSKRFTAP